MVKAKETGEQLIEKAAPTEQDAEAVIVRIDESFKYRGASFVAGSYYLVTDWPIGFVDFNITKAKRGEIVADTPAGAEVKDDPRPSAVADRQAKEDEFVKKNQQPPVLSRSADQPGVAAVVTTHDNVFGGTDTPEGYKLPERYPGAVPVKSGDGKPADAATGNKGSGEPTPGPATGKPAPATHTPSAPDHGPAKTGDGQPTGEKLPAKPAGGGQPTGTERPKLPPK